MKLRSLGEVPRSFTLTSIEMVAHAFCVQWAVFPACICEADEITESGGCGFAKAFACKACISLFWDCMVVVVLECL